MVSVQKPVRIYFSPHKPHAPPIQHESSRFCGFPQDKHYVQLHRHFCVLNTPRPSAACAVFLVARLQESTLTLNINRLAHRGWRSEEKSFRLNIFSLFPLNRVSRDRKKKIEKKEAANLGQSDVTDFSNCGNNSKVRAVGFGLAHFICRTDWGLNALGRTIGYVWRVTAQ